MLANGATHTTTVLLTKASQNVNCNRAAVPDHTPYRALIPLDDIREWRCACQRVLDPYSIAISEGMEYILEILNGILAALVHDGAENISKLYGNANAVVRDIFGEDRSFAWAGISSIGFFMLSRSLIDLIARRREAGWRRKIQGWWIEDVKTSSKNHVSLFQLSRHRSSGEFIIHGHTFINNGTSFPIYSEWYSIATAFPEADVRGMFYIYQSKIIFGQASGERLVFGLAHLTFYQAIGNDDIFSGSGYLYDSTPGSEELRFSMTKITKSLLERYIGRSKFVDSDDRVSFLRAYTIPPQTEVHVSDD